LTPRSRKPIIRPHPHDDDRLKKRAGTGGNKKANDPEAQFSLDGSGKRLENKMTV
jgi:hypothetical protein